VVIKETYSAIRKKREGWIYIQDKHIYIDRLRDRVVVLVGFWLELVSMR
jgi:hypothetical protein